MQRVTMEDVAREAGVSRALVSIAFRGAPGVSEKTREKIFATARSLGYVPNNIAARLAGKGSDTIGVFIQDLHNDIFADVYDGIRSVSEPAGVQLVLAVGGPHPESESRALSTLMASRVDVVIAAGLTLSDVEVKKFAERVRLITVARELADVDAVYSDNFAGAKLATEHLIQAGHRDIVFLSNPQSDGYLDRQRGYVAAMSGAKLTPRVEQSSYSRTEAAQDALRILQRSPRPTAIFAHNDQAALGVLDALITAGLKPGIDIAVVGYDNSTISQMPISALTTINLDGVELGRQAAMLALTRLESDAAPVTHHVLTPTLVVRQSSGG